MPKTKKEKWIAKEDKRLLDRHHANLNFFEDKIALINHCTHRIGLLHRSVSSLSGQYSYFNGAVDFDEEDIELISHCTGELPDTNPQLTIASEIKYALKVLRREQESYVMRAAEARKEMDAVGGDRMGSWNIYLKESKALSEKYDELFPQEEK